MFWVSLRQSIYSLDHDHFEGGKCSVTDYKIMHDTLFKCLWHKGLSHESLCDKR